MSDLPPDVSEPLLPAAVRSGLLSMRVRLDAAPDSVWQALTDPGQVATWMASAAGGDSGAVAQQPELLDQIDGFRLHQRWGSDELVWMLAPEGTGTQLQLVHQLSDPSTYADRAASWHLRLDSLRARLGGEPQALDLPGEADSAQPWSTLRDLYRQCIVVNDADN